MRPNQSPRGCGFRFLGRDPAMGGVLRTWMPKSENAEENSVHVRWETRGLEWLALAPTQEMATGSMARLIGVRVEVSRVDA